MWDWWWWCRKRKEHHQQQPQTHHRNEDDPTATITSLTYATAMILTSWLRTRRIRYLFLVLCSPLLLPFLCATFPLLCAAEVCIRLCRRRSKRASDNQGGHGDGGDRLRLCEEGGGGEEEGEVRLLQRYLEDQLVLVGSVYDCGDDDDDGEGDVGVFDSRSPLLPS